jgi:hypothetical protein
MCNLDFLGLVLSCVEGVTTVQYILYNIFKVNEAIFQSLKLILRPMVRWPVCFRVEHPSGAHDQICITVGHLRSSCYGGVLPDERMGL